MCHKRCDSGPCENVQAAPNVANSVDTPCEPRSFEIGEDVQGWSIATRIAGVAPLSSRRLRVADLIDAGDEGPWSPSRCIARERHDSTEPSNKSASRSGGPYAA